MYTKVVGMKIDIITLFPEMFRGPFNESIIKKAQEKKLVEINIYNLRDWAKDKHKTVDGRPYGGGVGMLLMIEPIYNALKDLRKKHSRVILMTPQGKTFNQKIARGLSEEKHLILIAGRYEGFDARIREHLVDEEISIGDYVLAGGEIPAMVVVDAVTRLIPGVLKKEDAVKYESFSEDGMIEYPQYTRPEEFKGWKVPEVLLSGHHERIKKWREKQTLQKTKKRK